MVRQKTEMIVVKVGVSTQQTVEPRGTAHRARWGRAWVSLEAEGRQRVGHSLRWGFSRER